VGLGGEFFPIEDVYTRSGLYRGVFSSARHLDTLWVTSENFIFSKTRRSTLGYIKEFPPLQVTQTQPGLHRSIFSSPDVQTHCGFHRRILFFSKHPYPLWVLLSLLLSDTLATFAGSKWPWYHFFPFIVAAKHDLNYTSTVPYTFMVWCCVKCRDILTFVL